MVLALEAGKLVGGRYRLEQQIARGGMGFVWRAIHEQLDAPVAVKFMVTGLEPSLLARFEREAKACARLVSPHIVKVSDFGMWEGAPFMVMELLEGEDLGARLKREQKLELHTVARIAEQIGKGLAVAHAAGIVHRDLKPANVFLARTGREEIVKLLDFGVARETEARLVDDHTTSGLILGSPHHMSPEQAAGEPVDPRSDLWSFGVLLYQAVTGKRPFDGTTLTATLLAITTKTAQPPTTIVEGLPSATDAFFVRALARSASERFQSAEEMVLAFLRFAGESPAASLTSATREGLASHDALAPAATQPVAAMDAPTVATGSQVMGGMESAVQTRAARSRTAWLWVPVAAASVSALAWVGLASRTADAPAAASAPVTSTTGVLLGGQVVSVGAASTANATASVSVQAPSSTASLSTKPAPSARQQPTASAPKAPPPTTAQPKGTCPAGKAPDPFTGLCVTKH